MQAKDSVVESLIVEKVKFHLRYLERVNLSFRGKARRATMALPWFLHEGADRKMMQTRCHRHACRNSARMSGVEAFHVLTVARTWMDLLWFIYLAAHAQALRPFFISIKLYYLLHKLWRCLKPTRPSMRHDSQSNEKQNLTAKEANEKNMKTSCHINTCGPSFGRVCPWRRLMLGRTSFRPSKMPGPQS